jgi:hypothetical protein
MSTRRERADRKHRWQALRAAYRNHVREPGIYAPLTLRRDPAATPEVSTSIPTTETSPR